LIPLFLIQVLNGFFDLKKSFFKFFPLISSETTKFSNEHRDVANFYELDMVIATLPGLKKNNKIQFIRQSRGSLDFSENPRSWIQYQSFDSSDCSGAVNSFSWYPTNYCFPEYDQNGLTIGSRKYECAGDDGFVIHKYSDLDCLKDSSSETESYSSGCSVRSDSSVSITCSANSRQPSIALTYIQQRSGFAT
jgi:hypothetical protein